VPDLTGLVQYRPTSFLCGETPLKNTHQACQKSGVFYQPHAPQQCPTKNGEKIPVFIGEI